MKRHLFSLAACMAAVALQAQNPIIQTSYTADPAPSI